MVIVNLERIRAQLSLTEQNLDAGAIDMAFAHAFITHSTIFPSAKSQIEQIDNQLANQRENLLTDLILMSLVAI